MKKQSKSAILAQGFLNKAKELGFTVVVRSPSVVSISKAIIPNNSDSFMDAEIGSSILLSMAPLKGGSIWGSDGGSIGGAIAMKNGFFEMKKSGEGSNFMKALKKLV